MEIPQTVKTDIEGWKKTTATGVKNTFDSLQEGDFSQVGRDIKKQLSKVPKGVWIGLALGGVIVTGAIAYNIFSRARDKGTDSSKGSKKSLH